MNIGIGGHHGSSPGGQGGKTGFTALFIRRPIFALVVNMAAPQASNCNRGSSPK